MALTLSDMDNFTLAELDDFSLEELPNMSYTQLLAAVQTKYQIANERCNKDMPLSEKQIQAVTAIAHACMENHREDSLSKTLTTGVAINAIWAFLCFLTSTAIDPTSLRLQRH